MIAWLFPGQGSQHATMFANAAGPALDAVLAESRPAAGDLSAALAEPAWLASPRGAQVALFVLGVASARELQAAGVPCDAVGGHSVGAFAAAVAAGVLEYDAALRIVIRRAALMAERFGSGYGMAAIVGLDLAAVDALVEEFDAPPHPLFRANVNAPKQVILAGARAALEAAVAAASARGARTARLLDVPVPSHCALLEPVATALAGEFSALGVRAPRVPFAGNVGGRLIRDGRAVLADALANVAHPVRWDLAAEALWEAGARTFIEMRPGRVLRDLAESAFPDARAVALEDVGVAGAVARLPLRGA